MRKLLLLMLLFLIGCQGGGGGGSGNDSTADTSAPPPASGAYVLGSSYSWDAAPWALDSEPEWHIYCGRPLDFIYRNPDGHCVGDSTPWPDVLDPPAVTYGYLSFQPIPGDGITQAQDVSHISEWMANQPMNSVAIIHPTWPIPGQWEEKLHDPNADHTLTNYTIAYYYDLIEKLEQANPGRAFVLTRSNEMMDFIHHDASAPIAFDELFRDAAGHMSAEIGLYLQHNAFRQAMDQATGIDSTVAGVDPEIRDYLDAVVALHPPR